MRVSMSLLVLGIPLLSFGQEGPPGAITARSDVHLDLQSLPGTGMEALGALGTAVQAKMSDIRSCYDRAVRATPSLAGNLRMLLETSPRGTVARVTVAEDHLHSIVVSRCVTRVLKRLPRGLPVSARGHIVVRFTNTMANRPVTPPAQSD